MLTSYEIARLAVQALDEKKAKDITVLKTEKVTVLADYFIICTASSSTHGKTLVEETDKIMSAQRARGADFDSGGLMHRVKALVPILVPLFVSAFRRADELATAMECRLYRGDIGRTRMRQLKFGKADAICAVAAVFVIGGAIAAQIIA